MAGGRNGRLCPSSAHLQASASAASCRMPSFGGSVLCSCCSDHFSLGAPLWPSAARVVPASRRRRALCRLIAKSIMRGQHLHKGWVLLACDASLLARASLGGACVWSCCPSPRCSVRAQPRRSAVTSQAPVTAHSLGHTCERSCPPAACPLPDHTLILQGAEAHRIGLHTSGNAFAP